MQSNVLRTKIHLYVNDNDLALYYLSIQKLADPKLLNWKSVSLVLFHYNLIKSESVIMKIINS